MGKAAVPLALACALFAVPVLAHDHQHSPGAESELHDQFYDGWMMPSDRTRSCCNKQDCRPARAFYDATTKTWTAWSVVRGDWIEIPPETIEHQREVPAGPHICENSSGVLCFGVGGGT